MSERKEEKVEAQVLAKSGQREATPNIANYANTKYTVSISDLMASVTSFFCGLQWTHADTRAKSGFINLTYARKIVKASSLSSPAHESARKKTHHKPVSLLLKS